MALLIDSVRRNFGLKVTAVVVAVVLWFTFNYFSVIHAGYSKTIEIGLAVRGVSAGLVASTHVERVSVELSGSRPDIDAVTPADVATFVDCTGKPAGAYSLAVTVLGQAADKVKTVEPAEVVVVLDRYAYRSVPVIARDPQGGPVAHATLVPTTIQIAGAQSAVALVVAAEVNVPDLRALPAGFEAEMKPTLVDARLEPVNGVTALGVVRVSGPKLKEPISK